MQLKELKVNKLFGRFDYLIPLLTESENNPGITILTAPNGYGKSTLLKIIADIAQGNYFNLARTNFEDIALITTDNIELSIKRNKTPQAVKKSEQVLIFNYIDNESKKLLKEKWILSLSKIRDNEFDEAISFSRTSSLEMARLLEHRFPFLRRIGPAEWRDIRTNRILSRYDIIRLTESGRLENVVKTDEPEWLTAFRTSLQILHIPANRLRTDFEPVSPSRIRSTDMVEIIADRVSENIKNAIRKYADEGRRLEQGFPNRIIYALRNHAQINQVDFQDQVMKLADDIRKLEIQYQDLGLLSQGQTDEIDRTISDESALIVLKTYLEDIMHKFAALEETADRLRIFVETINNLLLFKSLQPSIDDGFRVVSNDDSKTNIPLTALSSGEQHLIVLLGELVFGTTEGTLILLDEPEISFHPDWQERFPHVLGKIVDINKCAVVMATHSPTLVQNNWDSVIELADQVEQ